MKYTTNRRINVRTIRKLADNQGITLRNGKEVQYKTGWQVGIKGIEVKTAEEVSRILHSDLGRKGNIGIWYSGGIYYIDVSKRITTKKDALTIGKLRFAHDEISDLALVTTRKLLFTSGEHYYELRAKEPLCLRKYLTIWENIRS